MLVRRHQARRVTTLVAAALTFTVWAVGPADAKKAKPDPALSCVAAKDQAAATFCGAVLNAWSKFEKTGDSAKRDATIAKAQSKLDAAWSKADDRGTASGIDCGTAFIASSTAGAFVDSTSGALVGAVNAGLDLGTKTDAKCGSKIVKAAAGKCQALLVVQSVYQKQRTKTGAAAKRDAAIAKIEGKFATAFGKAKGTSCPTTSTATDIENRVDAIVARIVNDTLTSPEAGTGAYISIPGVPTSYLGKTFTPVCMDGSPYRFFARRGTVNKLVVYYEGGGACWEQLTCSIPVCDKNVTNDDDPNNAHAGFADLSNPANPFRDWNAVFVSYCSCDIHFGDSEQNYTNVDPSHPVHVEHRGYENSRVVEKWARDHFLAPEEVFVTGSSAGAYGAWFNAPLHEKVWPSAHFNVLADAGNGVVTQQFLQTYFPNWNFEANLPPDIPELKQVLDDGQGIPGYTEVVTKKFPTTNWAHYASAFDGGTGGQTGFYNIMLNNNDVTAALTWWNGSCAFYNQMHAQAVATVGVVSGQGNNYRYYIGSGSRHTMWGSDKVYNDTTGGVPTLVVWMNAMLGSKPGAPDPGWLNVEASPFNVLLPGDPRPSPLAEPFEQSGSNVVVNCPPPS